MQMLRQRGETAEARDSTCPLLRGFDLALASYSASLLQRFWGSSGARTGRWYSSRSSSSTTGGASEISNCELPKLARDFCALPLQRIPATRSERRVTSSLTSMEGTQPGAELVPAATTAPAAIANSLDASDHDARNQVAASAAPARERQAPLSTAMAAANVTPVPNGATGEKRSRGAAEAADDGDEDNNDAEAAAAPAASPVAGPPPLAATPAAKPKPRARPRASDAGPAKKKRRSFAPGTPTAWCHQDHQPHDLNEEVLLHCSNRKAIGKPKPDATEPLPTKPCTIKYCEKCLEKQCVPRPRWALLRLDCPGALTRVFTLGLATTSTLVRSSLPARLPPGRAMSAAASATARRAAVNSSAKLRRRSSHSHTRVASTTGSPK